MNFTGVKNLQNVWVGLGDFDQKLRNWQLSKTSVKDMVLHTLRVKQFV